MITLQNKPAGHRLLELGGGDNPHPLADVCVDVRPGPRTHFTADFNEPLPISSDDFEVVFCQYTLEHISYRKVPQFLAEVFRVTKLGGKVVFVTADTAAQVKWVADHPEGWDGRNFFESASGILFGDQDYPENSHKCYFTRGGVEALFKEAGFHNVNVRPCGARDTDLLVEAVKPQQVPNRVVPGWGTGVTEQLSSISENVLECTETLPQSETDVPPRTDDQSVTERELDTLPGGSALVLSQFETSAGRASLFDCTYFNGGGKVGGYAREGYWDYPIHEVTAQHVLARKPASVLELGCARGYVLKRVQDAGVPAVGLEISKHCFLTRVCDGINLWDLCQTPWPVPMLDGKHKILGQSYDLCFSIATLEHVPEQHLPAVVGEMVRTCKRGLHGIDFGGRDDGFDKTHVTLRPKEWWDKLFTTHAPSWPVEVVDKQELESGDYPKDLFDGDGRLKVNVGCGGVMFHRGWLNVDVLDFKALAQGCRYKFLQHDVKNGLPFGTGVVDCIVAGQFLQCLTYDDGLRFLRECRRVIRKDGLLRLSVPNVETLSSYYHNYLCDVTGNHSDFGCNTLGVFDELGGVLPPTDAGKLWHLLVAGNQSMYDTTTLVYALDESGWYDQGMGFRVTKCGDLGRLILCETFDTRPGVSLFVEATPKLG